jgi:hypothetical protein
MRVVFWPSGGYVQEKGASSSAGWKAARTVVSRPSPKSGIVMHALGSLTVVAFLAACASEAELVAQKQRDVDQMVRIYGPACERLGYGPNTNQWRDCVLRLSTKDSLESHSYPAKISCFGPSGLALVDCTVF